MKNDTENTLPALSAWEARVFWKYSGMDETWGVYPGRQATTAHAMRFVNRCLVTNLDGLFVEVPRPLFGVPLEMLQDSSDRWPMPPAPDVQTLHRQLAQYRVTPARAP